MASSALMRRAISREDLRSRSSAAWFGCSVLRRRRVDGLRFKLDLSGLERRVHSNCFREKPQWLR